jgi:hypothetical protein
MPDARIIKQTDRRVLVFIAHLKEYQVDRSIGTAILLHDRRRIKRLQTADTAR